MGEADSSPSLTAGTRMRNFDRPPDGQIHPVSIKNSSSADATPAVGGSKMKVLGQVDEGEANKDETNKKVQMVPLHVAMDMNTSEVLVIEKLAEKVVPGRGLVSLGLHAAEDENRHITFQVMGKDSDIRELNAVVLSLALRAGRAFCWTSLQYLRNAASKLHTDDGIGISFVAVVGISLAGSCTLRVTRTSTSLARRSSSTRPSPTRSDGIKETGWLSSLTVTPGSRTRIPRWSGV